VNNMWLDENTYQLESGVILTGVELLNYLDKMRNITEEVLIEIKEENL